MHRITKLLCAGLLAAPLAAQAQQPVTTPVPAPVSAPGAAPADAPPAPFPQTPGISTQISTPAAGEAPPPQTATPASPVTAQPVPDIGPNYVLGLNDQIAVTVWREPSLSGTLVIRPDGKISMPLLGDVTAANLTPMALAAELTERLKKFINAPTVTVSVVAINSQRVYFVGEIGHQGPMQLLPGMTMLQAISAAGGLGPYANAKKIYVLRGPQGKKQKIPFDYKKALRQGNEQGFVLQAGDTVVVP